MDIDNKISSELKQADMSNVQKVFDGRQDSYRYRYPISFLRYFDTIMQKVNSCRYPEKTAISNMSRWLIAPNMMHAEHNITSISGEKPVVFCESVKDIVSARELLYMVSDYAGNNKYLQDAKTDPATHSKDGYVKGSTTYTSKSSIEELETQAALDAMYDDIRSSDFYNGSTSLNETFREHPGIKGLLTLNQGLKLDPVDVQNAAILPMLTDKWYRSSKLQITATNDVRVKSQPVNYKDLTTMRGCSYISFEKCNDIGADGMFIDIPHDITPKSYIPVVIIKQDKSNSTFSSVSAMIKLDDNENTMSCKISEERKSSVLNLNKTLQKDEIKDLESAITFGLQTYQFMGTTMCQDKIKNIQDTYSGIRKAENKSGLSHFTYDGEYDASDDPSKKTDKYFESKAVKTLDAADYVLSDSINKSAMIIESSNRQGITVKPHTRREHWVTMHVKEVGAVVNKHPECQLFTVSKEDGTVKMINDPKEYVQSKQFESEKDNVQYMAMFMRKGSEVNRGKGEINTMKDKLFNERDKMDSNKEPEESLETVSVE